MDAYALVLTEDAAMTLAMASSAERRKLAVVLNDLKTTPFRRGDLQERDASGRLNEVFVIGDWLVTYWRDDAARELRVVRLERIED